MAYSLVQLDFTVHREYIAEFLCIERNQPITMCYGSCVLADRLGQVQQAQEGHEEYTAPLVMAQYVPAQAMQLAKPTPRPTFSVKTSPYYQNSYSFLFSPTVFHPPPLS